MTPPSMRMSLPVMKAALLAGISVEYYTRLERGNAAGVSEDVLDGVARALLLDEAERAHLFDLVRAANTDRAGGHRPAPQQRVRPIVQRILDSINAPAYVRNGRLDILAANPLGAALHSPVFDDLSGAPNMARFIFLNPTGPDFFVDWDHVANDVVAILRAEAGRDPYDKRLSDLIGELSTRSEPFRVRWAAHNVKFHRTGSKALHHPLIGDVVLDYEALSSPATPANASSSTTPSPPVAPRRRSTCWPAGPRPLRRRQSTDHRHDWKRTRLSGAADVAPLPPGGGAASRPDLLPARRRNLHERVTPRLGDLSGVPVSRARRRGQARSGRRVRRAGLDRGRRASSSLD